MPKNIFKNTRAIRSSAKLRRRLRRERKKAAMAKEHETQCFQTKPSQSSSLVISRHLNCTDITGIQQSVTSYFDESLRASFGNLDDSSCPDSSLAVSHNSGRFFVGSFCPNSGCFEGPHAMAPQVDVYCNYMMMLFAANMSAGGLQLAERMLGNAVDNAIADITHQVEDSLIDAWLIGGAVLIAIGVGLITWLQCSGKKTQAPDDAAAQRLLSDARSLSSDDCRNRALADDGFMSSGSEQACSL